MGNFVDTKHKNDERNNAPHQYALRNLRGKTGKVA
jgi:hypothetical protein